MVTLWDNARGPYLNGCGQLRQVPDQCLGVVGSRADVARRVRGPLDGVDHAHVAVQADHGGARHPDVQDHDAQAVHQRRGYIIGVLWDACDSTAPGVAPQAGPAVYPGGIPGRCAAKRLMSGQTGAAAPVLVCSSGKTAGGRVGSRPGDLRCRGGRTQFPTAEGGLTGERPEINHGPQAPLMEDWASPRHCDSPRVATSDGLRKMQEIPMCTSTRKNQQKTNACRDRARESRKQQYAGMGAAQQGSGP